MTTILLLLLGYAVSMVVFVRWARKHAPEGYEDERLGFIMIDRSAGTEAETIRRPVEVWRRAECPPHGGSRMRGSVRAG